MKRNRVVWLFIIGIFLCFPFSVEAADCKKYQCITCNVRIDKNFEAVWNVQSNGDGTGDVNFSYKALKDKGPYTVEQSFTYYNFMSKDQKQLKCVNAIYRNYSLSSDRRTTNVKLSPKSGNNYQLATVNVTTTADNKKPVKDANSSSAYSCQYTSKNTTTSAGNTVSGVVATVTVSGKNVKYSFTDGYKLNKNKSNVTANMFDGKSCPKLFVYCGNSGNDKYCAVTTEANFEDDFHGVTEGTEGTENATADDLQHGIIENNATLDGLNQEYKDCDQLFNMEEGHLGWLIQKILDYIKIAGPILVVLLSALDYIRALASSEEDAFKKAQSKLIIRLIAAVALFLVPTIVGLLLRLINGIADPTCGFR